MFRWFTKFIQKKREEDRDLMVAQILEPTSQIVELMQHSNNLLLRLVVSEPQQHHKLDQLIDVVSDIRKAVLKRAKADEESRLGAVLYEITADDLSLLSHLDRKYVARSGAAYFNDIYATNLTGVPGCGIAAVKRIMAWRQDCIMKITEAEIVKVCKKT